MLIDVLRYSTTPESTLGIVYLDGLFECYSIEDTQRAVKVRGETRIPSGRYEVTLRSEGGKHAQYQKRYGDAHWGMLWIRDVPEFEWVYIHTGNSKSHTLGCLLVGDAPNNNSLADGFVGASRVAYLRMYRKVVTAMSLTEQVFIRYRDVG